jgi:hypothetical protein
MRPNYVEELLEDGRRTSLAIDRFCRKVLPFKK